MKYTRYESDFKNDGERATAADYVKQIKEQGRDNFNSKKSLLSWYFSEGNNPRVKFPSLAFLIEYINKKGAKKILSLGAGPCCNEHLLKMCIPADCEVTATDFNPYQIERAKEFFPNIEAKEFDFTKDDVNKLGSSFDLVVFFDSSFTMNDSEFIHLIDGLRNLGIKHIIDFGGYLSLRRIPKLIIEQSWCNLKSRLKSNESPKGRVRGYVRSKGERRRLYQKAGLQVVEDTSIENYDYATFVLNVKKCDESIISDAKKTLDD